MKVYPECIKCIVDVRLKDLLSLNIDSNILIKNMIDLLLIAKEEFEANNELTIIASRTFRRLQRNVPEIIDYYITVRRRSIDRALKALNKVWEFVEQSSGYKKFQLATKISIAGNILDEGVSGLRPPDKIDVEHILSTEFSIDHTEKIYGVIKRGKLSILWLFDNAGEAIYDLPLISILRKLGNKVIGVAKEDPGFQNDLTISDAYYAGIDKYVDKLLSTGYSGASIHLEEVSEEFRQQLSNIDLVIAKGMAHYEYLSTVDLGKPIIYLLIPKCIVLAKLLNVKQGSLVALYTSPLIDNF